MSITVTSLHQLNSSLFPAQIPLMIKDLIPTVSVFIGASHFSIRFELILVHNNRNSLGDKNDFIPPDDAR